MPAILDRARLAVARAIAPRRKEPQPPRDRSPGGFSFGTGWSGGPFYTDAFQSKRSPSPWELVERYGRIVYAMAERNKNAVTRLPLRLYADASRAQGMPARACDWIKVSRSQVERFARDGLVSPASVDRVVEVRTHPMLDSIDRPDPQGFFDRRSLIGLMVVSMDILGSGFLVPQGRGWDWKSGALGKAPPELMWVMYAQYVQPIREAGNPLVQWWQYFGDRLAFESVLWFRQTISLRDPYGSAFSPAYAGDQYQDQEGKFIAWYDQFFSGARPNLVVSPKDPMMPPGEVVRQRHEQDLNRKHSGGNAGGAIVTEGAYDYNPINYPPTDEAGKNLAEYDLFRLASIFGQPPTYYTVDSNLANLQAADEQHARNGVEPRCQAIAGRLTRFVQMFDPRLFFAFDAAIQEDSESKEKVIAMRLSSGRTTINQENEDDRWPPVPWGDEPWLASTLKQPSMIVKEHEQGMEQASQAMKNADAGNEREDERIGLEKKQAEASDDEGGDVERALLARIEQLKAEVVGRVA